MSISTSFNSFLNSSLHTSTTRQTSMVSNITLSPMALQHMPEQGDLTKKNCLLLKQNFFIWKSCALSVAPNLLGLHPFMWSLNLGENGDYRRLNASTDDDRYPLPHIQDFNNHLAGCTVFSKIDLVRGYHQIPMAPSSIAKTAVITPFGLWEFLRMPFGLKNAAQSFQRLMDGILRDVRFAFVYLDDILVASRSSQDHLQHLSNSFSSFPRMA